MIVPYLLLSVVLIVFWYVALRFSGYELMAPVPLMLLGVVVSVFLAMAGLLSWNEYAPGILVLAIVVTGCISVLVGALLMEHIFRQHMFCRGLERTGASFSYQEATWKYVLIIVVILMAMLLRIYETMEIAEIRGITGNNYFEASKNVRDALAAFNSSEGLQIGVGFSMVERQLEKLVAACGYVITVLLARKIALKSSLKSIIPSVITLIIAIMYYFLTGGRGTVFFIAVAFIAGLVFQKLVGGSSAKIISFRVFGACVISAAIGAIVFYSSGFLLSRPPSGGIIEYISFYFGCGVPSLESFFEQGIAVVHQAGALTFYNLFSFLYKIGLVSDLPSYSIAWVNLGGHGSNIFTCFARYYLDFGMVGVVVMSALAGAFMTAVYRWARASQRPFAMVLACYLAPYAFDMAREEYVFSSFFSMYGLLSILILFVVTVFLTADLSDICRRLKAQLAARARA